MFFEVLLRLTTGAFSQKTLVFVAGILVGLLLATNYPSVFYGSVAFQRWIIEGVRWVLGF
jgi:hypothetical protein